jgi:hypothetical protein
MHPQVHFKFNNIFHSFNQFINHNSLSHLEIVRHLMGIANFFTLTLTPQCFLHLFKTFKWNSPNHLTYQVDDMSEEMETRNVDSEMILNTVEKMLNEEFELVHSL